jgi:REP element-mobilizing transposase RayT
MNPPLGFFLTFRTYGTWLHGDARGSVDDEHNAYGTPYAAPDLGRAERAAGIMCQEPMVFDIRMRETVEAAIRDACAYRGWKLIELKVRSNHVHVVVKFAHVSPERMAQRLKARATLWLRERGHVGADGRVWVEGPGSRRYLWTEQDVADAALYVREYQDEPRR